MPQTHTSRFQRTEYPASTADRITGRAEPAEYGNPPYRPPPLPLQPPLFRKSPILRQASRKGLRHAPAEALLLPASVRKALLNPAAYQRPKTPGGRRKTAETQSLRTRLTKQSPCRHGKAGGLLQAVQTQRQNNSRSGRGHRHCPGGHQRNPA